jgi:hypothetical protein
MNGKHEAVQIASFAAKVAMAALALWAVKEGVEFSGWFVFLAILYCLHEREDKP